jgi:hypothetical protein
MLDCLCRSDDIIHVSEANASLIQYFKSLNNNNQKDLPVLQPQWEGKGRVMGLQTGRGTLLIGEWGAFFFYASPFPVLAAGRCEAIITSRAMAIRTGLIMMPNSRAQTVTCTLGSVSASWIRRQRNSHREMDFNELDGDDHAVHLRSSDRENIVPAGSRVHSHSDDGHMGIVLAIGSIDVASKGESRGGKPTTSFSTWPRAGD